MSRENVEIVRRNYEVINAIDRKSDEFVDPEEIAPDHWASLAPDMELHGRPDVPDARIDRGREGVKEFFLMLQEVWAELRWEPLELTDHGDTVVVEAKIIAIGRRSDIPIEADETDVFWFRDSEIVRLQGFPTKAEALEAAGLSE